MDKHGQQGRYFPPYGNKLSKTSHKICNSKQLCDNDAAIYENWGVCSLLLIPMHTKNAIQDVNLRLGRDWSLKALIESILVTLKTTRAQGIYSEQSEQEE